MFNRLNCLFFCKYTKSYPKHKEKAYESFEINFYYNYTLLFTHAISPNTQFPSFYADS